MSRPKPGRTRAGLALALMTTLLATGCLADESGPSSGEGDPAAGGELVIGTPADVASLDPVDGGGTVSTAVRNLVYNHLVKYTPDLEVVPDLATEWEAEGTEWTFQLRQGVTFHDGTPFNADAVKAHFDRLLGPEEPVRAGVYTPFVERVEVVDDHTVRFVTTNPDAFFLSRLAEDAGAIPSPTALAEGVDLSQQPVGTGAFRFVEWVPDVQVVVERNDDYWDTPALLDRVVFRPIGEAGARTIALEAGDIHVAAEVPVESLARLEADEGIDLTYRDTTRQLFFGMHNLKEPFDNVRVRLALNLAVDMESIVESLYGELGTALNGSVPPAAVGSIQPEEVLYDPQRARDLLAEAGYPDGLDLTMVGPRGRYLKDFELQQAVAQELAEVGVTVEIESVEFAQYLDLVRQPTESSELHFWQDAWSRADAAGVLRTRYHCDSFVPSGNNLAGYCNPDLDTLIEEAEQALDVTARNEALRQAQELLAPEVPSIWGVGIRQAAAFRTGVHNVLLYGTEVLSVDNTTWIEP